MDLAELVGLRPVPCAGLLLTLTQRCPLRCAHCSSSSTMAGAEPDAGQVLRFVESFGAHDRPAVLLMTGGEPLLRPDLVARVAAAARRAGTRSALLTGAFFAGADRVPAPIMRAIRAVDHFSVSVDAFHERQIPRADVLRLLRLVRAGGTPVSVHTVTTGADDDYVLGLAADLRRSLGHPVPMLVNTVRPVGRAAGWANARPAPADRGSVLPCAMAAWPVVAHDGVVVACCNQDTVERRPVPAHLRLGHIDTDDWATVRERSLTSPTLRMIRTTGPRSGKGYCEGCRLMEARPDALHGLAAGPSGALLDRHAARIQVAAGPVAFLRRHGSARFAHLVAPPHAEVA